MFPFPVTSNLDIVFIASVGLTVGGLLLSVIQVASGHRLALAHSERSDGRIGIGGFLARLIVAPVVILRGVWDQEDMSWSTFMLAYAGGLLATLWSFCIGVLTIAAASHMLP